MFPLLERGGFFPFHETTEDPNEMARNVLSCIAVLAVLLLHPVPGVGQDNAAEPECLKGTIAKVAENALYLKNTNLPDDPAKRDLMILLDKDTKYFDGTKKITREGLQPDQIVLVYCKAAGKERKAGTVRIIGGKKL
jgi:hypothetical protein